ncbi:hypothetical protein HY251_08605 [bacterium]|nr:hypothetical protein [bacterium]
MSKGRMLDTISVATPCGASWEGMKGDERVRFCGLCSQNVYNLSGMPRAEAEALVAKNEGRLCVRFFQREDGTLLTQDCPVGFPALARRKLAVGLASAAAVLSTITLGLFGFLYAKNDATDPPEPRPEPHVLMGKIRMGAMAVPSRPTPPVSGVEAEEADEGASGG